MRASAALADEIRSPSPENHHCGFPGIRREVGIGVANGHHGEFLQGAFVEGAPRRALVTVPLPGQGSRVAFVAHPGSDREISVTPEGKSKAQRAATLAVTRCAEISRQEVVSGALHIESTLQPGLGMGSSTSDVVATVRAIAEYYGVMLGSSEVGRIAVMAEGASDPIMLDDRIVLFAHRDGVILETVGYELPPLTLVGCVVSGSDPVNTLELPTAEYDADELARFRVLRSALRHAVSTADPWLLGRVATASAEINQRFVPNEAFPFLLELVDQVGAVGVQVAHSGTVAGLLFDAARPETPDNIEHGVELLTGAGITHMGTYQLTPRKDAR